MSRCYYKATKKQFLDDLERNRYMPAMLKSAGYDPNFSSSETTSWQNNAPKISELLVESKLPDDIYVAFEYCPHDAGRIDCMLFGKDGNGMNNVVLFELKQWEHVDKSGHRNQVVAYTGGANRTVDHPCVQMRKYCASLRSFKKLFENGNYKLYPIVYCYNYRKDAHELNDNLINNCRNLQNDYPIYTKNDVHRLAEKISHVLCNGHGEEVYNNFEAADEQPTDYLINAVKDILNHVDTFTLYGKQNEVCFTFFEAIKKALNSNTKSVIVVKGGPGTGKTLIALKILAQLARMSKDDGSYYNFRFTTRSTALRDTIKQQIDDLSTEDQNGSEIVESIYDFRPYKFKENELDVLLIDEAHRVDNSSNFQSDREQDEDGDDSRISIHCPFTQTLSLIYCSKVTVFFIDDSQGVKNSEIGKSESIMKTANNYCNEITKQIENFKTDFENSKQKKLENLQQARKMLAADVENTDKQKKVRALERELHWDEGLRWINSTYKGEVNVVLKELKTQYRCEGAQEYVNWVDEILYKDPGQVSDLKKSKFDFQMFNNPIELYNKIKEINDQSESKQAARLVAGWCWKWSSKCAENGDLKKEVTIPEYQFAMPWETKANPKKEFKDRYAKSAETWAYEPAGVNQVGCIYSAQGFEFDYIGVILGPDIAFDEKENKIVFDATKNYERQLTNIDGAEHIRNIYRVLLTRGRKGCYVFCCDKALQNYLLEHSYLKDG